MNYMCTINYRFVLPLFLLFFISCNLIAQDFNFKPNWKVGTEKKIIRTSTEKKYEADSLVESFEMTDVTFVKVVSETKDTYQLEILKENLAILSVKEFYDEIEEKLPKYKYIKLLYELNKSTGEYKLLNWQEAKDFVDETLNEIEKVLEGTDYEGMGGLVSLVVSPNYSSEELTIEHIKNELGYIFIPFAQKYTLGDTVSTTSSGANPFNPMQEMSISIHTLLQEVENDTAIFNRSIEMDMSEVIEMIKSMMLGMANSLDISEEKKQEKLKEIESIKMEMNSNQIIHFDISSNWVTKVRMRTEIGGYDPQKGNSVNVSSYEIVVE